MMTLERTVGVFRWLAPGFSMVLLGGCSSVHEIASEGELRREAEEISRDALTIDTHIDLPYRLRNRWEDVSQRTPGGDFDYPRALEGGLDVAFLALYTPAGDELTGNAFSLGDSLIDLVGDLVRRWPDKFAFVHSPGDIKSHQKDGTVLFSLGLENGSPIQGSIEKLRHFRNRGVSYVTLCHTKNNHICDSSGDTTATWNGLSPFGKELVVEMNQLGLMIDVSHASDQAVSQILRLSNAPVIASHSGCRSLTPDFNRNLPDDLIRRIARGGGVVHVGFASYFASNELRARSDSLRSEIGRRLDSGDTHSRDSAYRAALKEYWASHDERNVHGTPHEVARHIAHIVRIAGIDHVGFGSDFEGSGDSLPVGLKDVSGYPNLILELLRMRFSRTDVEKICGGNTMRVWQEVLRASEASLP